MVVACRNCEAPTALARPANSETSTRSSLLRCLVKPSAQTFVRLAALAFDAVHLRNDVEMRAARRIELTRDTPATIIFRRGSCHPVDRHPGKTKVPASGNLIPTLERHDLDNAIAKTDIGLHRNREDRKSVV